MLILKVKLKANINLAFKNSEKHRQTIKLDCIASHPLLNLHNDCMACCDYSTYQMRLHNTVSSMSEEIIFKSKIHKNIRKLLCSQK